MSAVETEQQADARDVGADQPRDAGGPRRRFGRLAGDTGWAFGAELLTLIASLLAMYLISTRLGPADYGQFVGAQALAATLGMFSYASVGQLLLQGVVRDRRPAEEVLARCLTLLVGSTAVAMAAGFLLRPLLFPQLGLLVFTLLTLAELVGSGVVALASSHHQALDAYRLSVALRMLLLVLRAAALLLLATGQALSLEAVAWAYGTLGLLAAAAVLVHLRAHNGHRLRLAWPTRTDVRDTFSFSAALLAFSVHEDADKILLVRLADPVTAGLYAAAYRAVQVAVAPLRALQAASHRRFLEHDPTRRGEHVQRSARFTALGAGYGCLAAVAVVLVAPLLPVVLGPAYAGSVEMVRLLGVLVLLRGLGMFCFNGLMGLRAHGTRLLAVGSAAAVAALMCGVFIPLWAWRGAVAATLVAELVFVVLSWAALVRLQRRHDAGLSQ
ncbi:lipopolysaccharide biosynthesis protein [Modestobacter excelsi]|uniref:lipopolysaccharide biosynthesis protein n=1 Tax=Modestobacter excelsi TaxID=2213161 RepID=UPI00110C957A|nr:oligosaccharide flippase family protein [Modestobacter excelsi]